CLVLANDALVQFFFHVEQAGRFLLRQLQNRDAGPVCQDFCDLVFGDLGDFFQVTGAPLLFLGGTLFVQLALGIAKASCLLEVLRIDRSFLFLAYIRDAVIDLADALRSSHAPNTHASTGFVEKVNSLIWQEAIIDVAIGQRCRCLQRRLGLRHWVVFFVLSAQAAQVGDGVFHGRLINLYRLETSLQRRVLFNVLAVLIQRGRTNGLQFTAGQLRLEQG